MPAAVPKPTVRNAAATRRLVALLGGRAATTDAARFAASFDGSKIQAFPDAVVFPRGDGDIAATLRLANRFGVPVTVRGGGTSLTGSATPSRGGWALDLSRWKKIRLDASAGIARAQAGVVTAELQRAAEAAGWCYPPDPASRDYCTLGGNIATNAGGMRGGRHGVTRDYVLALEGFLPTGEKVRWGADTRKFSAGPNLRDLWIGSEGTLGVITAATLRLIPKPAARWTLLAAFKDAETAVAAGHALRAGGVRPEIFEFLDGLSARCAEEFSGAELFPGNAGLPVILLELAGTPAEVAAQQAAVVRWAQQAAVAFREASDGAGAEALWTLRRKCSPAMFMLGDAKLNEDVVLPQRAHGAFLRFLAGLSRKARLPVPTFGHLADGNFHVNILYHAADAGEAARAEAAAGALMRKVVALGGAISGEHGIGLAKTPFLRVQHGAAEVRAMLAVKRALDPRGILNPGKIFTPVRVQGLPRAAVKLPWERR